MTASHVNEFHGNSIILEERKDQVYKFLEFMKDIPEFKAYFINDFLIRGKLTLETAALDNFSNIE